MKWILDATLSHFICRNCSGKADEKMVEISGLQDSILQMEIRCPHCWLVSSIKAEVNMIWWNHPFITPNHESSKKGSGSIFDSSQQVVQSKKTSLGQQEFISDEDITKLRNTLGKEVSVMDVFWNNDI